MEIVTISDRWKITFPPSARDSLHIIPGQQLQVIVFKNHFEPVPVMSLEKARGFLRGIDTTIERDE